MLTADFRPRLASTLVSTHLYLSLMDRMGVHLPVDRFGDTSKRLVNL